MKRKRREVTRHKWSLPDQGRGTCGRWVMEGQKEARNPTTRVADHTRFRTRAQKKTLKKW
jgi:hypothetical protein